MFTCALLIAQATMCLHTRRDICKHDFLRVHCLCSWFTPASPHLARCDPKPHASLGVSCPLPRAILIAREFLIPSASQKIEKSDGFKILSHNFGVIAQSRHAPTARGRTAQPRRIYMDPATGTGVKHWTPDPTRRFDSQFQQPGQDCCSVRAHWSLTHISRILKF